MGSLHGARGRRLELSRGKKLPRQTLKLRYPSTLLTIAKLVFLLKDMHKR